APQPRCCDAERKLSAFSLLLKPESPRRIENDSCRGFGNCKTRIAGSRPGRNPAFRKEEPMIRRSLVVLGLVILVPCAAFGGAVVRSATGAAPASIQAAVDQFRTDLGGANNGVGGTFATGRREINWDGVPDAQSAPNNLPANVFNSTSPRGVAFSTPRTTFHVSAKNGNTPLTTVLSRS